MAEQLLEAEGYEGVYQIASFHPEYCFEGEDVDDPANFTNRSPYPMFHLLREVQLEQALEKLPKTLKQFQRLMLPMLEGRALWRCKKTLSRYKKASGLPCRW